MRFGCLPDPKRPNNWSRRSNFRPEPPSEHYVTLTAGAYRLGSPPIR